MRTRIYNIKLAAVSALLLCAVSVQGQSYKGDITVVPVRCEQSGDSVYVYLDIDLSDVRVTTNMSVELVPSLVSAARDYSLPVVSVKGRTAYKAWERGLVMEDRSQWLDHEAIVVRGYKTDRVIKYRYAVPYEDWMADAGLHLRKYDSGCGGFALAGVTNLAERMQTEYVAPVYTPLLTYVVPQIQIVQDREKQAKCRLDFVVNKTDINPSYMNNPSELAAIRSIIDELKSDPAVSIVAIEIIGHASPEGYPDANQRLSEGRALSMRNYLASKYEFPQDTYRLTFGGENWDGLVEELQQRRIDHYEEVLGIIETTAPDQTRKNRIMSLRGGAPYQYMLRNIYPKLRTVICKIEYRIEGFDAADALEVYRTRPQDLSPNEFYMVAAAIGEGTPEFVGVFETALRFYPDDQIANLNAAIAALKEKDTAKAAACLEKVTENRNLPEYHNAMGALLLLQNDIAGARVHFEQAAGESDAARENLKMISNEN